MTLKIFLLCLIVNLSAFAQTNKPSIQDTKKWIVEKLRSYGHIKVNVKNSVFNAQLKKVSYDDENLYLFKSHSGFINDYSLVKQCECITQTWEEVDGMITIPWSSLYNDESIIIVEGTSQACEGSFIVSFISKERAFSATYSKNQYRNDFLALDENGNRDYGNDERGEWKNRALNTEGLSTEFICVAFSLEKDLKERFEKAVKDLITFNSAKRPKEAY